MANSKAKKPKPTKTLWYSCIRRYYNIRNEDQQIYEQKKMWIVIGDGHKWYRKFETQAEAIRYFRKLKKYAKMRIQSVDSHKFVRNVSTFLELEKQGVEVKKIKQNNVKNNYKKWDDSKDFQDEFSKYDSYDEQQDDQNIHYEIDKVIKQREGDYFIGKTREMEAFNLVNNNNDDNEDLIYIKTTEIEKPDNSQQSKLENAYSNNKNNLILTSDPENNAESWINEENHFDNDSANSFSDTSSIILRNTNISKADKIYNCFKIVIVALMVVLGMAAIWFSSQWDENTLSNLGINFEKFIPKLADGNYDTTNPIYITINSIEWSNASQLGIYQWSNSLINKPIFLLLGIFSIIGILCTIGLLSFRSRSTLSIISFVIVFASLVIVTTIFIIEMIATHEIVSLYKRITPETSTNEILLIIRQIKQITLGSNMLA